MIDALKQLVVEKLDVNLSYDEFDQTTPLFEDGLAMDSIVFTEFVLLLEKTFNVEFEHDSLTFENFYNLEKVSQIIAKHSS
ncbi:MULTISPECIES: acyl carrier protein [Pseudoalteromonas]|uniref:Phosphopantetheine-binding protein n=1 Tax=Pseudoalteromonas obscura TaxID=3048491 RepID=A0ABT7EMT8_9GAMM|nr:MULTISPECIES: phosphopantetheine-binding protein [Pseudoalteromonas]MBQ4838761.1 hypothetical protein [Pseudoalteromonas luteoviolacea]MDK2596374.1 phosphopantetheine-binding protein [Pseudoalteromonas sp. P94(2023)]